MGQFFGNSQTQAGSAIFTCGGGIGLLEGLEQAALLLGSQSDARVADFKTDQYFAGGLLQHPDGKNDFAFLRELYRIAGVVQQYLIQPQRISDQTGRQVRIHVQQQFQPFGRSFFQD